MAENSKIEWTDHTFNAWSGCTKVSAACDHCYAESWAKRSGIVKWGAHARRRTTEGYWRQPLKWDRVAKRDGVRRKVFCCSLADVFDNQVDPIWRADLWKLIAECRHLDWLLLTKRPQNIAKMLPPSWANGWDKGWSHVWLGTTVENQEEADRRIPHLLATPAAIRFLSCEPLLGPVDLRNIYRDETLFDALDGMSESNVIDAGDRMVAVNPVYRQIGKINWCIGGGESGPNARPPMIEWARSLRDQCVSAGTPFFWKQWGEYTPDDPSAQHTAMRRVGKKSAGALLDGREHKEMPA
jgi:protein gp37